MDTWTTTDSRLPWLDGRAVMFVRMSRFRGIRAICDAGAPSRCRHRSLPCHGRWRAMARVSRHAVRGMPRPFSDTRGIRVCCVVNVDAVMPAVRPRCARQSPSAAGPRRLLTPLCTTSPEPWTSTPCLHRHPRLHARTEWPAPLRLRTPPSPWRCRLCCYGLARWPWWCARTRTCICTRTSSRDAQQPWCGTQPARRHRRPRVSQQRSQQNGELNMVS
jgi:hypothetical protein